MEVSPTAHVDPPAQRRAVGELRKPDALDGPASQRQSERRTERRSERKSKRRSERRSERQTEPRTERRSERRPERRSERQSRSSGEIEGKKEQDRQEQRNGDEKGERKEQHEKNEKKEREKENEKRKEKKKKKEDEENNKIVLRYASDGKENGWLIREAIRSPGMPWKSVPEKRLYFKLRGSTLTAHPNEKYPELWRSAVKGIRDVDTYNWRISLKLEKGTLELRAESGPDFERWVRSLERAASTSFKQYYKKQYSIGRGHFSDVYVAKDKATGEKFAVKVIKRDKKDLEKSKKFIRREVKILSTTNHKNIIKAIDFFSSGGKPHIVLEFIEGGSLRDLISKKKHIPEPLAREIFRGVLEGVFYLHKNKIVHRDMKPENILMAQGQVPKITDFGLATIRNEEKGVFSIHSVVGTPSYVAPELLRSIPYGPPADIWSCGIILYFMLSGERPFTGENRAKMKRSILDSKLVFPSTLWGAVSGEARDLVRALLNRDQEMRITAEQALRHPWFSKSFGRST